MHWVSESQVTVTPGQFANWDATNAMTSDALREGVRLGDAFDRIAAARPLPDVPAVVLAADKPWRTDLLPAEARPAEMVTFDDWLAAGQEIDCPSGMTLFQENTPGAWAHLVRTGRVRIVRQSGRREVTLGTMLPGDAFGEYALLPPGNNTATCRTAAPSRLLRLKAMPPITRSFISGPLTATSVRNVE